MARPPPSKHGSGLAQPKRLPGRPKLGKGKGKNDPKHPETEKHAKEVREVARGRDIVDRSLLAREVRPPLFKNQDMLLVRSWMMRRPLEPTSPAAALVHFPRMWSTKRGRYCRFQAPGAGVYGLLRARPTF
jgi:hypothetical protein